MSEQTARRIVERSSTRSSPRRTRLGAVARSVGPVISTPVVLGIVLLLGIRSTVVGVAALAAIAGLVLVTTRGFEQSALILLSGAFLMAPLDRVRPVPGVEFVSASDLLFLLGFMVLAFVLVERSVRPRRLYVAAAAAVLVAGIVVSLGSSLPASSLAIMVRLVIGAVLLPLLLMVWAPGLGALRMLAGAYVLGNVGNVVYGAVAGPKNFEGRILGYSEHYNVLGLCALLGLALVPFLLRESRREHLWFWAAAGGVCAYGIWASGSRAALLVAAIVGLLYPVFARSIRIGLTLTGAGIVVLYFVGSAVTAGESSTNAFGRLFGNGSASASDQVREDAAQLAFHQFQTSPYLGNGLSDGTLDAHNVYLQVAASGGVVLVLAFVLLLAAVVRQPFVLGPRYRLLVLPALAYALIAPLTSVIWDRYIWCVLALPFLIALSDQWHAGSDALEQPHLEESTA